MFVMDEPIKRERNTKTETAHKREVFWQITFPLIIGVLFALILAVLVLVSATSGGSIKQAADAALICLIVPLMFFTLIGLLIFGATAFGLVKANQELPFLAKQAQDVLERVRYQIQVGADKTVEPIIKIRSFLASISALKRK
jgi:uncharacterized Tic20 family protein